MNGYASMGRGSAQPFTPTEIAALHALASAGYPVPPTLFKGQDLSIVDYGLPQGNLTSTSLQPLGACQLDVVKLTL